MESQAEYIAEKMKILLFSDAEAMMVRKTSQSAFVADVDRQSQETTLSSTLVKPWYQNEKGINTNNWASTHANYAHLLSTSDTDDYLYYDEENNNCTLDDTSHFGFLKSVYQHTRHFFVTCRYMALDAILPPIVAAYMRYASA